MLLILVVVLGVTGIVVRRGSGSLEFRTTARHIATTLRYARNRAIAEKKVYFFIVDEEEKLYGLYPDFSPDKEPDELTPLVSKPIPESVTVVFKDEKDVRLIEFYPRGTSSGGTLEITSKKDGKLTVHVNRITGRVTLYEDDEK